MLTITSSSLSVSSFLLTSTLQLDMCLNVSKYVLRFVMATPINPQKEATILMEHYCYIKHLYKKQHGIQETICFRFKANGSHFMDSDVWYSSIKKYKLSIVRLLFKLNAMYLFAIVIGTQCSQTHKPKRGCLPYWEHCVTFS